MAKPLKIELAGDLYHVTSQGDRREGIYLDDKDRRQWLILLDPKKGMVRAYLTGDYTMKEIANAFDVHYASEPGFLHRRANQ